MADTVIERLDSLRDGFMTLTDALRMMLETQRVHGEMLQRIMTAVEEPPSEESNLEKLLAALVGLGESSNEKLDRVLAAVAPR
jgi:hypothetical protein